MMADADPFLIDSSMTMAWFFADEATEATNAVLDRLRYGQAFVPPLWFWEVTNVMLVGERRRRVTQADTARFITLLHGLPITVDGQAAGSVFSQVLLLARAHSLSVYDAAYLELAQRLALPLATLDGALQRAAEALGVPIL